MNKFKYISQVEFEYAKESKINNSDNRFIDLNFFKQQFSYMARPCTLMVDKLEQQFKLCLER